MNNAKVTVGIAVYNIDRFVEKCIQSVLEQDYKNLEIILIDDNSSDNSGNICDKYAKLDKRVKVIHHKKNTKLYGVRNECINLATGEYIVFIDGDDWIAKDCISYLVKVIKKDNADFGINLSNYTSRDTKDGGSGKIQTWTPEETLAWLLWPKMSIGAWNKIYRTSFVRNNSLSFKPLFTSEGLMFITEASQKANKVAVGDKRVYYYRKNNQESATTKYDIRQSLNAIKIAERIKNDLTIRTAKTVNAADHQIWTNHVWNIRQIKALQYEKKYNEDYRLSRQYLHKNMLKIFRMESKFSSKIQTLLIGFCPSIMAKALNRKFENELRTEIKNNI